MLCVIFVRLIVVLVALAVFSSRFEDGLERAELKLTSPETRNQGRILVCLVSFVPPAGAFFTVFLIRISSQASQWVVRINQMQDLPLVLRHGSESAQVNRPGCVRKVLKISFPFPHRRDQKLRCFLYRLAVNFVPFS